MSITEAGLGPLFPSLSKNLKYKNTNRLKLKTFYTSGIKWLSSKLINKIIRWPELIQTILKYINVICQVDQVDRRDGLGAITVSDAGTP